VTSEQQLAEAVARLRNPETVRARCQRILAAGHRDELPQFRLFPERLPTAVGWVMETLQQRYPTLEIPYHSRWRHFGVGEVERWTSLLEDCKDLSAAEIARIRFDLAVTSVLLDAGAGDRWRFVDPVDGRAYTRSEGLAVASFTMFREGFFSAVPGQLYRADADGLEAVDVERLGNQLQVTATNSLVGLDGRCQLLRRLSTALRGHPRLFGATQPRVGNLFDALLRKSHNGTLPAAAVLSALLIGLADVWPDGYRFHGVNIGDVGFHPVLDSDDATAGLVPFHKLSQWLTYSLVEPLEEYGIEVTGLEALTALAEYRNGGLLVDTKVLAPRDPDALGRSHAMNSELIVEWRALTIALIDEIADTIRERLGRDHDTLPLAAVLEGGTWWAGRRIALKLRQDGGPPIRVESAATVF
jgi:hypothetical protein